MRGRSASLVLGSVLLLACSSGSSTPSAEDGGHDAAKPRLDAASPDATTHDAGHDGGRDSGATKDAVTADAGPPFTLAPWNTQASIFIDGFDAAAAGQTDCRTENCRHNEDTDMIAWQGAIYMVHRTAVSQVLGPNSSLIIYKSVDDGASFQQVVRMAAPETPIDADDDATMGRDIRDPAFFIVTDGSGHETLHLKAITRLPTNLSETQTRDTNVESISVGFSSTDGTTWSPLARLAPNMWSFWRVKELGGTFYSAAYHDGDSSVSLFSSPDGVTWTQGAEVFGVTADTPLETELVAMPNGDMLALVRTDGSDADLAGDDNDQQTQVCWAKPPYATFECPETILGERLDGPVAFFWQGRLFVIARRHIETSQMRKRTSLFELSPVSLQANDAGADGGTVVVIDSGLDADLGTSANWGPALDGGPDGGAFDEEPILAIKWWGDLPSAGDTAYAGVAFTDATHARVVWYAGDVTQDEAWYVSLLGPTNIWLGTIDFSLVH